MAVIVGQHSGTPIRIRDVERQDESVLQTRESDSRLLTEILVVLSPSALTLADVCIELPSMRMLLVWMSDPNL